MNRTKSLTFAIAALGVASLTLVPGTAAAQVRTRDWGDRAYRSVPPRRDWVVRPLVDRAERQSNSFRAWFERTYKHRHLGEEADNRQLKHEIQHMDEAMERLRSRADDHRPGIGREDLLDALDHASRVDREIFRDPDARFTHREWDDLRLTLNNLADLYNVRGL